MLPRSVIRAAGGGVLLVAATALAVGHLSLTLQGEPGPPGESASAGEYYTLEEATALFPAPADLVLEEEADALYAAKGDVPNMSAYATVSHFEHATKGWLDLAALEAGYWKQAELPDYQGYVSQAELGDFAAKADIPSQEDLVYPEQVPDPSAWLTTAAWTQGFVQHTDLAANPTKSELNMVYLEKDAAIPTGLREQIEAIIEDELANPTCTADAVAVGQTCVDRYEASLWEVPCGAIGPEDVALEIDAPGDLPSGFSANGRASTKLYACSRAGAPPAREVTWFQAARACAESGKRLCTNAEWQAAAIGTPSGDCNAAGDPKPTGGSAGCVSAAGAMDMAGNVSEFVADWTHGGPTWEAIFLGGSSPPKTPMGPLAQFYSDTMVAVNSANLDSFGLPFPLVRGGAHGAGGATAGPLAVDVSVALNKTRSYLGFRCCRRR